MHTVTRTPTNMSDTYIRVYTFQKLATAKLFMKMMVSPEFNNVLKEIQ